MLFFLLAVIGVVGVKRLVKEVFDQKEFKDWAERQNYSS